MQARMTHPAFLIPAAMKGLQAYGRSADDQGVPATTLEMVHLRASQINGCSVCVELHANALKKAGESDERIFAVAAWRDAPYFTDAERAALELAEATTRVADRGDPVSDELWAEISRHYDERGISALLIAISAVNVWNRLNAATRQPAGQWKP
ncbi:alkylhydroperoxidase [Prauserella sp. PE36]|uniref:Carboxymuconolactone decarboxylase family protein n=1 Tax=Prauserella endophytica TaxID=1592324 RepID=A0ABY2S3A4_9PSEU|nr:MULTISPECIES: carboxymuconolactone decarboxylase family protein [Prauserella]RBM23041.1 alkylhydroperoxidase [Prauserella sp. PE36]TKG70032.1 carboxymuconolactone decarboxylase family protein [Prauserella endophytica]